MDNEMGQSKSKSNGVANKEFIYEKASDLKAESKEGAAETPTENDVNLVPAWVTEERFHELLSKNLKDFVKIVSFKAYPAMAAGENYATLMLRAKIEAELKDGTRKPISFVLKVPHDSEQVRQMMEFFNVFIPENGMYFDVIPELEQMYKEAGQEVTFAAKVYKFPTDPNDSYVLLEDLCPNGYQNTNRLECLDLKHSEAVLAKLAKFHAVSATRVATKGPYDTIYMDGIQDERALAIWKGMMDSFKDSFLNQCKSYKNGEQYYELVEKFFDSIIDQFIEMAVYKPDQFNVLNHGDSWSNNILFKYKPDGEIEDVIYVDYQMSKFGSPAQDLLYFILSSVRIDYKLKNFDYLIRFYHEHLIDELKLLKYPKKLPSLRELHIHTFKNAAWAVMTSMMTLPIVLLDSNKAANIDNFMSNEKEGTDFKKAMFSNDRYRKYINEILPWLHDRGYLEVPQLTNKRKLPGVDAAKVNGEEKPVAGKVPEWVTEDYFVDVLKENFTNFKQIKKFAVEPATSGGDNYASILLKVDIDAELADGSIQPASYMLKIPPAGEQANAMLALFDTFKKEEIMYDDIIPAFEKVYKDAGITNIVFGPESYHFTKSPGCDVILLKNLRPEGFANADRFSGLDLLHTQSVLRKMAQFHAASAIWLAAGNKVPPSLLKTMYVEENRKIMEAMGMQLFDLFLSCVSNYKGAEQYIDKLRPLRESLLDVMIKVQTVDENVFNVINHGDMWVNNLLFQHNADGEIAETYFIDYQITKYGTPAQDLFYFLMSSPSIDIKKEKFDYFIEFYYFHLKRNLELLKYTKKIPTLQELQAQLKTYHAWGASTVLGVLAAVLLDPSEDASIENMLSEDQKGMEFKKLMYSNARYRSQAEVLLPWLNERGWLDFEL